MGHPASELGLKPTADFRIDPDECAARTAAEPFQAAADVNVDAQRANVDGDRADGLVAVDDGDGSHLASLGGDRRDVVNVSRFEQDVRKIHDRGLLVDRLDQALRFDGNAVFRGDDGDLGSQRRCSSIR